MMFLIGLIGVVQSRRTEQGACDPTRKTSAIRQISAIFGLIRVAQTRTNWRRVSFTGNAER